MLLKQAVGWLLYRNHPTKFNSKFLIHFIYQMSKKYFSDCTLDLSASGRAGILPQSVQMPCEIVKKQEPFLSHHIPGALE